MLGMGVPESHELGKDLERVRAEVMLDHFNFLLDGLGTQSKQLQQLSQGLVPHLDMARHCPSLRCQRKAAVFFIVHVTAPRQPSDHVRHRRPAQAQRSRDVRNARIPFLVDQFLDSLQVVLRGFRPILVGTRIPPYLFHSGVFLPERLSKRQPFQERSAAGALANALSHSGAGGARISSGWSGELTEGA